MMHLLTNQTASLSELREPMKVIEEAGDSAVAIMNRNHLMGYYVPAAMVDMISVREATEDEVMTVMNQQTAMMTPVNEYLRDK